MEMLTEIKVNGSLNAVVRIQHIFKKHYVVIEKKNRLTAADRSHIDCTWVVPLNYAIPLTHISF